jgi:hypothetical protein
VKASAPRSGPRHSAICLALFTFLAPFASASDQAEFKLVEKLARDFFIGKNPARAQEIRATYLGRIEGATPNTAGIDWTANATLRLRNGSVARIQLLQKAGRWTAARDLGANALPEAHPQLVEELRDPERRETARLEQRMAAELESRLQREGRIAQVSASYPRCFVSLEFEKALCDIRYATWKSDEPECFDTAALFSRATGQWARVAGNYHPGMRIHPQTGAIFEMVPPEPCAAK